MPVSNFPFVYGKPRAACKDCIKKYSKIYRDRRKKLEEMDRAGINTFMIERKYKKIFSGRIALPEGIERIAKDEIFVRAMDCPYFFISNYGRGMNCVGGKYELAEGITVDGRLYYKVLKSTYDGDGWELIPVDIPADVLVVQEYVVNPDCVDNTRIFHQNGDLNDCHYKNLYPLNEEQYAAAERIRDENGRIYEEEIVSVMNDRRYLPEWFNNKIMKKTMVGIGYVGCPDRDAYAASYKKWRSMMHRCYNDNTRQIYPTYGDCTVCEEWHNYRNFRKWFDEHNYVFGKTWMPMDKDILYKGNHEYGPSACAIMPMYVNEVIHNNKSKRVPEMPMGVIKDNGKYAIRDGRTRIKNLWFETKEEAFEEYKMRREKKIHKLSNSMRGHIPEEVCNALAAWKINIDD